MGPSAQAVLRCAKCGAFTTRLRLLMQIADQAVQNSKDFLERFRFGLADDHALPRCKPRRLDHDRSAQIGDRAPRFGDGAAHERASRGDAGLHHDRFRKRL